MQDSGSLAVFKVTARDQGHYKGPSGAFVTYCNISCFLFKCLNSKTPLICTLANEYPSSYEISKKNGPVKGDCIACNALLILIFVHPTSNTDPIYAPFAIQKNLI